MCGFVMGVLELVYGRGPCVLIARLSHRVGVEGGEETAAAVYDVFWKIELNM